MLLHHGMDSPNVIALVPSYNTGRELLRKTIGEILEQWNQLCIVIDGSTDGSDEALEDLAPEDGVLHIIRLPENQGKGAAILAGLEWAKQQGGTHILTIDADGQHPTQDIPRFLAACKAHPEAWIAGEPVFDDDAPSIRVQGRKISNFCTNLETLWWGINDVLFGMRLYPIEPLLNVFAATPFARRFDFDTEVAVRLSWNEVPVMNLRTPVKYLSKDEGGISQFRYGRDNALLISMHTRLFLEYFLRLPRLLWRRRAIKNPLRHATTP